MTQQRTVLIIDCCSEARKKHRQYLLAEQEFAYAILEAESGQSGLELCQKLSLDSIVLEYQLPDFNGLELLAQLRAKLNGSCPPVVMVTDRGNEAIAVKALKSGAEDYLVKGQVTADELRLAVRSAIANAQLRQTLQASEQRFKTSVENLLDCFGIYTSIRNESGQIVDFQVEYVNPVACEHNCMTQEQQVGRRLCELLPAHKNSDLFEEYCRVVETGEPLMKESLEYTDIYGDRCLTRAFDIRISKLNDGFVASWRDVTARKQAEIERERLLVQEQQAREAAERNRQQYRLLAAKLRESDRCFRAIFNATFQFIGSLSPEGILLEVNQTALDFSGVTKEEVIDRPFWETKWWTISPQTQAQLKEAIERAAAGEFVRYEVDVLGTADRVATIDFSLKPVFDETGRVVLLIPEGRDISDKKQAEAELRRNQERLQRMVETAQIGIAFARTTGEIVEVNNALLQMLGYTREEFRNFGINWRLLSPPEYAATDRQAMEQLQRIGRSEPTAKALIRKDGTRVPILLSTIRLQGEEDEHVAFIVDLTERDRIEQALRQKAQEAEASKQILDALMEYIPEGITIADAPDVRIHTISKHGQQLSRRGTEFLADIPFEKHVENWDIFYPDGTTRPTPEALPLTRAVKRGEVVTNEEWVLRQANGEKIPILCNAGPIYNQKREIIAGIIAWHDITVLKQADAALRQSEALFRGIFESDLIGILFWNIQGQITDANDNFCRMTGYSRAEIQAGKISYNDITPPEFRAADAQKFEILQSTGKYAPIEKEYICKDGSRIPILLGCAFLPGYRDRGVAFVLDISEKKQWEREREALLAREQQAREQAETANRNKDEFLAIVSHELRSPLNSILGWAKLLRTRKYDSATANRALETIERNAQAQSQLIEDLLDISRMIRGTLRLNLAPVNLINVVESTVTSLRLAAQAKNIALEFQLPNSSFMVSGDLYRLQQIATNLLTNAIKFTPSGGRVEVTLMMQGSRDMRAEGAEEAEGAGGEKDLRLPISDFRLPTSDSPKYAQIQVTDTGKGISPDFLPYIFERFRQVDDPTIRSKNGLGLGLAIVRHLVELHGGTVTAASPGEGQGATFTVLLPLLEESREKRAEGAEEAQEAEGEKNTHHTLQGVRILVVDDDADTREFLHFALTLEGAVVKVATSAQEALEILHQFQLDAIVSDIGMPTEDGYSLLRQVRSQAAARGEKQIPAIALTAFARESDRQQAMSAGFQAHLTKPVVPADLADAIVNLIQNAKNSKYKT